MVDVVQSAKIDAGKQPLFCPQTSAVAFTYFAWNHELHPPNAIPAVGASGAASIRPSLTRSAKKGPEAIRRTALSAAQEQKLILCTSLLKEVRWLLYCLLPPRNKSSPSAQRCCRRAEANPRFILCTVLRRKRWRGLNEFAMCGARNDNGAMLKGCHPMLLAAAEGT
eukprot:1141312-Pelagomonas_calceolata.AAC.2